MPTYKTKRFSFWRARFSPEPYTRTLQSLLHATFDNTSVRKRLLEVDEEERHFRFINYKTEIRGCFCANFFGYEKGRIGQVIKEAAFDAEQIDPSAIPAPPADDGTVQQYLDGKLYLICHGDDLVLAQDMHLKAKHLERYLNAKLRTKKALYLEQSLSLPAREDITGVRNMTLSSPLQYTAPLPEIGDDERALVAQTDIQHTQLVPVGRAWNAVKEFFGDALDLRDLNTRGFIDPQEINVSLHLSWKRKRQERASDQLDALANTVRHVDEDDLEIELETLSGVKVKRNALRLSKQQSVEHDQDFPVSEDIFEKMIEWYEELVDEELV